MNISRFWSLLLLTVFWVSFPQVVAAGLSLVPSDGTIEVCGIPGYVDYSGSQPVVIPPEDCTRVSATRNEDSTYSDTSGTVYEQTCTGSTRDRVASGLSITAVESCWYSVHTEARAENQTSEEVGAAVLDDLLQPNGPELALPPNSQFVPCDGGYGNECQFCHMVYLIDNVVDWLVEVLGIIAVIMIIGGGLYLVSSAGNTEGREQAYRIISNMFYGYLIVLAGWFLVDTTMKIFLPDQQYGVWNDVLCVTQPRPDFNNPLPGQSRGTASGLSGLALSELTPEQQAALVAAGGTFDEQICAQAAANGIADQCTNIQALMRIESSGCRNKISLAGAYGCMQILPSTARQYDPELAGLTDQEIANKLVADDAYSIALGTRIYADAYSRYNGNTDLVYAAYNGGFGANESSVNCPGMLRWQCEWDGDGCINGTGTNCRPNTGYQETRNYVNNINRLATELQRQ